MEGSLLSEQCEVFCRLFYSDGGHFFGGAVQPRSALLRDRRCALLGYCGMMLTVTGAFKGVLRQTHTDVLVLTGLSCSTPAAARLQQQVTCQ
jgi:hypothetical protein